MKVYIDRHSNCCKIVEVLEKHWFQRGPSEVAYYSWNNIHIRYFNCPNLCVVHLYWNSVLDYKKWGAQNGAVIGTSCCFMRFDGMETDCQVQQIWEGISHMDLFPGIIRAFEFSFEDFKDYLMKYSKKQHCFLKVSHRFYSCDNFTSINMKQVKTRNNILQIL